MNKQSYNFNKSKHGILPTLFYSRLNRTYILILLVYDLLFHRLNFFVFFDIKHLFQY